MQTPPASPALSPPGPDAASSATGWRRVGLLLVVVYAAVAMPLILLMGPRGRAGEDQINYHEPAVHRFAEELPRPDLRDYLSATTPGYHLVLAGVERLVSADRRVLQGAGALFTVLLLLLLARTAGRLSDAPWTETAALCLPFACSMYVLQAGVWILPDNAGWLMVLACMALALAGPCTRRTVLLAAVALVGVVLVRQVHLWVAGTLWAAAWLAPGLAPPGGVRELLQKFPARARALAPMVLATIPALVVLAAFIRMWGGLTPPTFQGQYAEVNLAAFPFLLALLGIVSAFHAGYLADPLADLLKGPRRRAVLLAALAGGVVAIIPDTTYSVPNRSSGLWNLVKAVPVIAGHTSPVLVVLSAFGAGALVLWWRALPARPRWIFLGAFFAFGVAQAMAGQIWQRYNEPMVLISVALMAAASRPTGACPVYTRRLLAPARFAGVAALALLLAALSAVTIARSRPAAVYDIRLINPGATPPTPQTPASPTP